MRVAFPQPKYSASFSLRERLLAAGFFALAITVAFPNVVFWGRSLVATEQMNPLENAYTAEDKGPNFVPAAEWATRGLIEWPNFHDPGSAWWQAEPGLHFFRRAVLSGQFPLWDPSTGGGAAAYTNLTQSFLFPPQIALCLAGASSAQKNAYILLCFWASAFGTYCILRMHGILPLASAAAGLLFLFSGAVQQIGPITFMAQVVACMPFLLVVTKWFVNDPSWRRTAILAATYAVVSLASFPPILIGAFAFTTLFFCSTVALEKRLVWRVLLRRYSIGVLLSFGIVAAYYLPTLISVFNDDHASAGYRTAGLSVLPPRSIFGLLSPTSEGTAIYASAIMPSPSPEEHLFYVGITALLLAPLAFGKSAARVAALVVVSGGCAILILLKIFGVPPVHWIALLPFFRTIHYSRYFGILLAFIISLLSGIGLDRLIRKAVGISGLAAAICLVGGMVGGLWLFARHLGAFSQQGAWHWVSDYRFLVLFAAVAFIASSIVRFSRRSLLARARGWVLLALSFVEGTLNATYPRQRRWDVFAHPPHYVSFLQEMRPPSRIFQAEVLRANLGSAFGIDQLDSLYTFFSTRMYELYVTYTDSREPVFMRGASKLPPEAVLDRAGIESVLINPFLPSMIAEARDRQYPVIYDQPGLQIFGRNRAPRYFFSSEYQVTDRPTALKLIATRPSREIVLETTPPFPPAANSVDDPSPELVSVKLNSLDLRIHAPRPGLLYLADAWDNGWSATVNGQPAGILVANYAFRAIALPAGDVTVKLSYLPVGFALGAVISALSLIVTITLTLRKRNKSSGKQVSTPRRTSMDKTATATPRPAGSDEI